MATHSDRAPAAPAGPPHGGTLVEYEEFIEGQLRKTRSHVRSVDVASALMTLAAGTLGYFFVVALVDHWVVYGGLGFWGRLVFLAVYLAAALTYLAREVLPLVVRRINPVFAAYTIERSRPSLKNVLVNFLLFRANPAGINEVVYQAIEEQAATHLAKVHVEVAVDRTKLIRIGYALAAMLLVCALYTIFSPKDLLRTVGRVVMPWAEIGAPTRTEIVEIEPGDTQAFRGQQVTIKARVQGLAADGKVTVLYTTADGQVVDRPIEMKLPPEGYQHLAVLPAGNASLQQTLSYRIQAGDAVTKSYRVEVVAAPTIVVHGVEYHYPSYTGLLTKRVEHQGDLKAIEGTEVTLEALANQDIQSAYVDFDCDQKLDLRMQTEGQEAKATFRLTLQDDRRTPEHDCYHLVFKNEQGQQNPQPVRHQIEVTRDLPPEIQFVGPKQDELDLPLGAAVNLEIVANDPDFALRTVQLSATSGGQPLLDKRLLDETRPGQFVKKLRFDPRKLGLKVGDVVEYWAAAEDNKDPRPNRSETARRRIRVVSPTARPPKDQIAQGDRQRDPQQQDDADAKPGGDDNPQDNNPRPDEKPPADDPEKADPRDAAAADANDNPPPKDNPAEQNPDQGADDKNDQLAGNQGSQRPGGPSDKPNDKSAQPRESNPGVPADGSDDGEAIEKILKHRDEQKKSEQPSADAQRSQREEQKPGGSKQPSDDQSADPDNAGAGQPKPDARQQRPEQKPGGENGKKSDQRNQPSPSPKTSPEQPDKSQGQQGAKDSQAGDNDKGDSDKSDQGQGDGDKADEANGQRPGDKGQQGQQGQKGQKGQKGKPSAQGKSSQAGEGGEESTDPQKTSPPNGKGPGKPTDARPGDDDAQDEAAPAAKDAPKGRGTPREKPAGTADPQATDEQSDTQQGQPQPGDQKSAGKPNAKQALPKGKPDGAGEKSDQAEATDGEASDQKPANDSPADQASKPGQGAQSKGDSSRDSNRKKQPSSREQSNPDAKGGDGEKEKGSSGAGQAGKDRQGSPNSQGKSQPREKSQPPAPDDKDAKQDDAAQSPSNSEHESNTQGQEDGDRSGGGKKGGGQKANKSGTGGAGQNTAADEGAGRSDEPGRGEDSDRAGGNREAGKKTGQSGSKPGQGSQSKPSTDSGGKSGQGTQGASPQSPAGASAGDQNPAGQDGQQAADRPSGGKPSDNRPASQKWKPTPDAAEEANLEYARKATDLALEHLKDELRKEHPDAELLKQLGWSRADLENFVKRWEQMRRQAQSQGDQQPTAQRELDETLRSLGLRPRGTSLKSNAGRDDKSQGYKESRRSSPPPEYAEQYKEYTQGVSRGGK